MSRVGLRQSHQPWRFQVSIEWTPPPNAHCSCSSPGNELEDDREERLEIFSLMASDGKIPQNVFAASESKNNCRFMLLMASCEFSCQTQIHREIFLSRITKSIFKRFCDILRDWFTHKSEVFLSKHNKTEETVLIIFLVSLWQRRASLFGVSKAHTNASKTASKSRNVNLLSPQKRVA